MPPKVILMTTTIQLIIQIKAIQVIVKSTAFHMVNPMAVVQIQMEAIQAMKDPSAVTTMSTRGALRATSTVDTTAV